MDASECKMCGRLGKPCSQHGGPMTATEINIGRERLQESSDRWKAETLGPLIDRELKILEDLGYVKTLPGGWDKEGPR